MDVFVARQPIFDRNRRIYAYELLYRNSMTNSFDPNMDSTEATTLLLNNSYITIGIDNLTENKRAFVNFDENLILDQAALLLNKEKIVVEVLETVVPNELLLAELKHLKNLGYTLALDDFTIDYPYLEVIELCDIIKVDFSLCNIVQARKILEMYSDGKKRFLAEKIENEAIYKLAMAMGYDYFQGYYFSKPVIIKGKSTKSLKIQYARARAELNSSNPDFSRLASIIESDVDMSYKLLRMVNSFALTSRMTSIRHALAFLGIEELKKWLNFVVIQDIMDDRTFELIKISVLRSKFCELLAEHSFKSHRKYEASLAGLFSMIDVLLEKPLAEVLAELPISEQTKGAISGEDHNAFYHMLQIAINYEKGLWDDFTEHLQFIKVKEEILPELYFQAVKWADDFMLVVRGF